MFQCFSQNWLATSQLNDDGVETPIACKTTIRRVIAIPGCQAGVRIEIGQMQGCDVARRAVNLKPASPLPNPPRPILVGQSIIEANGASHHEDTLGDIM